MIIGLASPNLRSNGFSLIRRAVLSKVPLDDDLAGAGLAGEVLLEPSVLYAPAIGQLLAEVPVHGLAHITGGGIRSNLERIMPGELDARIDVAAWSPPPVFGAVAEVGGIEPDEMFATFNMGIGFIVIVAASRADQALRVLHGAGRAAAQIGTISDGAGRLRLL